MWGVARIAEYGEVWYRLGWLATFFYAACAGIRLARFNSRAATSDKRFFEGLPSPSGAALLAGFVWTLADLQREGLRALILAFVVAMVAGSLMVSRFRYLSGKDLDPKMRIPVAFIVLLPLGFVLVGSSPPEMLFALFALYASSGPADLGLSQAAPRPSRAGATGGRRRLRRGPMPDARQVAYLRALGVDVYVPRDAAAEVVADAVPDAEPMRAESRPAASRRSVDHASDAAIADDAGRLRLGGTARSRRRVPALRIAPDADADRLRRRQPAARAGCSSARRRGRRKTARVSRSWVARGSCSTP